MTSREVYGASSTLSKGYGFSGVMQNPLQGGWVMDSITFEGLERSKGKLLRSVLRRGGSSNAASLSGYAAVPHSEEAKTPISKRYTYFVDALKGVQLTQETENGNTTHKVILRDVVEAISVSSKGHEDFITPEKLAGMIGTGKEPFTPNGSFIVTKNGTPKQCSFAFDKATYDPKTHDMTFSVDLLTDEASAKPEVAACFDGESMSYDEKLTLFLDSGAGGM